MRNISLVNVFPVEYLLVFNIQTSTFVGPRTINTFTKYKKRDATFVNLFSSQDVPHVSGGSSAHHQDHKTVHTASGIVNQHCRLLVSWKSWNSSSSTIAAGSSLGLTNTRCCMYSYELLMMGRGTA